jgi:hypothetical protein|tara:strand:- start:1497 stop:1673 length:177 start_codon:yes stop_codon:yes gene_type:complete
MTHAEAKETVEFIIINATGISLSLTNINEIVRTLILIGTLIYTIIKIAKIYREWQKRE